MVDRLCREDERLRPEPDTGRQLTPRRSIRAQREIVASSRFPTLWSGATLGWAVLLLLAGIGDRVLDAAETRLARCLAGPRADFQRPGIVGGVDPLRVGDSRHPPTLAGGCAGRIAMIEIRPYDAAWPERFARLGAELRGALHDVAVRIDHIGSTAVPGLAAKPILDVQISVACFDPLAAFRTPLETLGYVYRADNPERTKRYFREPPGTSRTHIHVRRAGSFSEQFALLFRDYLRAAPHVAAEYEALKRSLARRHRDDRRAYTEAKVPFFWEAIRRADEWAQELGWMPGRSDA